MFGPTLDRLAAPKFFYPFAGRLLPWLGWLAAGLLVLGAGWGLGVAPADYQQGDSYRIMFIHVPAAWLSMLTYMVMAGGAFVFLVWRIKLADILAKCCAPLGAAFTALTLVTGSLWGKPMWGTWWAWDARLTSELVLLFLYLGLIALRGAIDEPQRAGRATALLALVGVVNIPIIHFSVEWWNTLHQPASLTRMAGPAIHPAMLTPLLLMIAGFTVYFAAVLLQRMRCEILEREQQARWLTELDAP
ncbi:heme ABC transporter permease [Immundisolibacter sp.]|uniref:heme ABC transporter permease n=1 Tax=Immundisolibacter sp. TaxID=1934948 RepID=UPI00198F48AF|nr:heme ABC transporter permease [Immundisolibacter sp.]MBC7162484.1 heme ABC transporter permease [Immundisolibacter sp.]MEA3219781.1 Heme exporter protein C [Immundisolibacter sp.]